jgi:hypothetical protein
MEPSEIHQLKPGALVWVWIVRFGKGRWWPGMVEEIETKNGSPLVKVRFESFSASRHRTDLPVTVGFIPAPMRRLERRDCDAKGGDRPRFVPSSRLRKPELPVSMDSLRSGEVHSRSSDENRGANGAPGRSAEEVSRGDEKMPSMLGKDRRCDCRASSS